MGKEREIKSRMKAVANIKRITNTMQMIATARFQSALKRATSAKPFTQMIAGLVGELASAGGDDGALDHPLLHRPEQPAGRELLLVITSNRGLCGAYNGNVLRSAVKALKEAEVDITLEVVGKKGVGYMRYARIDVAEQHEQFGDQPAYTDVESLANRYISEFTEGKFDRVRVAYMAFESVSRQNADVLTLLPLEGPTAGDESGKDSSTSGGASGGASGGTSGGGGDVMYDFSPDPEGLLDELLPTSVRAQLYQCFNEAVVGEQVARMVAMKSATDAAGKMGTRLTREYNRARQTAITTELTEIIAGAAALG